VRNDSRIINKLHRRVFMDKISLDDVKIYVSFYCEASNRDAFMAIKQVSKLCLLALVVLCVP
jgi:MscS family membrane protein